MKAARPQRSVAERKAGLECVGKAIRLRKFPARREGLHPATMSTVFVAGFRPGGRAAGLPTEGHNSSGHRWARRKKMFAMFELAGPALSESWEEVATSGPDWCDHGSGDVLGACFPSCFGPLEWGVGQGAKGFG